MRIPFLHRWAGLAFVIAAVFVSGQLHAQSCDDGVEVCFNEGTQQKLPVATTQPVENSASEDGVENHTNDTADTGMQQLLIDGITADLKARRLMRPKGNNALNKVRDLRKQLPTHDYAINGERYIARVYMVLGRAAVKNGRSDIAQQRLRSALKLDKNVAGQVKLQKAIAAMVSGPTGKKTKTVIVNYADSSKKLVPSTNDPEQEKTSLVAPVMVAIPAGKFVMGSEAGAEDEKPMREVSVDAFSMSKHEITLEQYRAYAVDNNMPAPQFLEGDQNRPVTHVSWQDAQAYVLWLSNRTQKSYKLPTEAQWEYAARAGTVTPFYTGEELMNAANCVNCGSEWGGKQTAPVGRFPPNPFGLYDMHGNVWEWVQDCWTNNYFGRGNDAVAIVKRDCDRFVMRGGSWYNEADYTRSSYRGNERPEFRDKGVGFRVVHDGL